MADLIARTPFEGLLPPHPGAASGVTVAEVVAGSVTSLSPFAGKEGAVNRVLHAGHGLTLPPPGTTAEADGDRLVWTGIDEWMLIAQSTAAPNALAAGLQDLAAVTDQSDGWGWLALTGEGWPEVLARLCPLDPARLGAGSAARSEVAHMMAILYGTGEGIVIGVMRSFAATLAHEVKAALASVEAQKALR